MASTGEAAVKSLLAGAHSPDSVERIFAEKIKHRPILLRPSSPPPAANAREERRRARQQKEKQRLKGTKPKPLSARKRKGMCLYEVPKDGQKYALFEPLHNLWLGYIREVLGNQLYTGGQGAAAKLCSADFHGAEVEVSRSGCVSRVGIKGIVIKDAKFVFEIVTRKNKLKIVPKEGTMFRVEIPAKAQEKKDGDVARGTKEVDLERKMVVEILGDQFSCRSSDRATKKFKSHFLLNI